jgi:hypothetical protein
MIYKNAHQSGSVVFNSDQVLAEIFSHLVTQFFETHLSIRKNDVNYEQHSYNYT